MFDRLACIRLQPVSQQIVRDAAQPRLHGAMGKIAEVLIREDEGIMRHLVDQVGDGSAQGQEGAQWLQMPLHQGSECQVVALFDLSGQFGVGGRI